MNPLSIASSVEAAVEAYISVWDITDKQKWKAGFQGENVGAHLHGVSITLHLK
jgi:hypothetical protein